MNSGQFIPTGDAIISTTANGVINVAGSTARYDVLKLGSAAGGTFNLEAGTANAFPTATRCYICQYDLIEGSG